MTAHLCYRSLVQSPRPADKRLLEIAVPPSLILAAFLSLFFPLIFLQTALGEPIGVANVGNPKNPEALAGEVAGAYRAGAHLIIINPGIYQLPATGHTTFELNQWQNVVIRAYGVTLIMAVPNGGDCFDLSHCRNVSIEGPTISQSQVTFYQGRVVKVGKTSKGFYCDWRPDAGYPVPSISSTPNHSLYFNLFNVVGGRTRRLKVGDGDLWATSWAPLGNQIFRLQFQTPLPNISVGDWLVARYMDAPQKIRLFYSRECTVKDVTLMRNGFAPILEWHGGGNHLLGCRWALGPKPNGATVAPVVTNEADGFHSVNADPGPDIEHCFFQGVFLDDCIAIHGELQHVVAASGRTITVKDNRDAGLIVGGPIQISGDNGFFATARVVSINGGTNGVSTVTLDRKLAVPIGAYVTNPDRCGSGYKIIDCRLGDTRSRGIIVKGSSGVIIGNVIRGCGMAGISIGPEISPGQWWEGGYCQNVIVEDNTLIDNGKDGYNRAVLVHGSYYSPPNKGAIGNSGIVIKHNTFVSNYGGDIWILWTSSGDISRNTMTGPPLLAATGNRRPPSITIDHSDPIHIGSNRVTNPTAYATNQI